MKKLNMFPSHRRFPCKTNRDLQEIWDTLKTKLLEINTEDLISKEMAISNLQHYEMPFLLAITTNTMISEDCEKMYRNWGFKETKLLFLKKLKAYLTMTRSRGGFERRMLATDIKRVISEQSFIQKSKSNLFGR